MGQGLLIRKLVCRTVLSLGESLFSFVSCSVHRRKACEMQPRDKVQPNAISSVQPTVLMGCSPRRSRQAPLQALHVVRPCRRHLPSPLLPPSQPRVGPGESRWSDRPSRGRCPSTARPPSPPLTSQVTASASIRSHEDHEDHGPHLREACRCPLGAPLDFVTVPSGQPSLPPTPLNLSPQNRLGWGCIAGSHSHTSKTIPAETDTRVRPRYPRPGPANMLCGLGKEEYYHCDYSNGHSHTRKLGK